MREGPAGEGSRKRGRGGGGDLINDAVTQVYRQENALLPSPSPYSFLIWTRHYVQRFCSNKISKCGFTVAKRADTLNME